MIKLAAFIPKAASASHEDLVRNWEHVHAPNVARAIEPLRYTVTFFDSMPDGSPPPYAGMACLFLRDAAHAARARAPETTRKSAGDGFAELIDPARAITLVADGEHVQVPLRAPATAKLVGLVQRAHGVDFEDFSRSWLDVHAVGARKALGGVATFAGYTVTLASAPNAGPYGGMAELWWTSPHGIARALSLIPPDDFSTRASDPKTTLLLVGREAVIV